MGMNGRRWAFACGLLAAALLGGCASFRPATVPLRTLAEPAPCAVRPDTLIVLLPGSYSLPEDFRREGFVRMVRERQLAADLLLVDAHVGYYANRSILERLHADVIAPARAQGYRQVWLAGISIGGLGAMLYAEARPGEVDGLVLLAPYLGTHLTAVEIRAAGGLAAWPGLEGPMGAPGGDPDVRLWRWLQAQTAAAPARPVPIYLGYGLDDRFAYNDEVLAQALPPTRVFTTEGGHDWPPWQRLWQRVLDALPIGRESRCERP
jgi:pimeloyl-ACP methyl ester carboxylesterase